MEGIPAFQIWDRVFETVPHSDSEGHLRRPTGKRHSLAHSVDHVSFDLIDHVPSDIPESSFPAG